MKLDFLIPASATPAFFSQIAFFRLALNALGGDYAGARVVAVFGDHEAEVIPSRWQRHLEEVDIVWAHPPGAFNPMYREQHIRRFEVIREDADLAVMCDADVSILRPFDTLAQELICEPALAGVIAHYHPSWKNKGADKRPDEEWPELTRAVLGRDIDRPHRYTLVDPDTPPQSPFYINYGVFMGTPELMEKFYTKDAEMTEAVSEVIGRLWGPQVSVALTCDELQLPTRALPMRYNFPNDRTADEMYPDELEHVVFMHYLRDWKFDRMEIFATESAFEEFLGLRLKGSDLIFQDHVKHVTGGVYPFSDGD